MTGFDNCFLDMTPKDKKIDQLNFLNIKYVCASKDPMKKLKRQSPEGEKTCENPVPGKKKKNGNRETKKPFEFKKKRKPI